MLGSPCRSISVQPYTWSCLYAGKSLGYSSLDSNHHGKAGLVTYLLSFVFLNVDCFGMHEASWKISTEIFKDGQGSRLVLCARGVRYSC